jgi:hypothetical protein
MFYDELKSVSIAAMEEAIARAISGLAGTRFNCTISNIDLSSIHGAKIDIFLAPPNDFDLAKSDPDPEAIA